MSAPAESGWYRKLVEIHGREGVWVGTTPAHDGGYWVSSRDEDAALKEEHQRFYDELSEILDQTRRRLMPEVDMLEAPYLNGSFFGDRTETMIVEAATFDGRVAMLVDFIAAVQRYLAEPANRRWRVGYFDQSSLLIYPDAIFIGGDRHQADATLAAALPAWLDTLD